MKRYWKSILLAAVTLVAISSFYLQSAASSERIFQVNLRDVEGNRGALNDATIQGNIQTIGGDYDGLGFQLYEDTTLYEDELSYFDQLNATFYKADKILHYNENYRSFMRGKTDNPQMYFETEKYILYGNDVVKYQQNATHQSFEISRLNKKTEEFEDFIFPLNEKPDASYMYVNDVFYKDNRLTLLVQQDSYEENIYRNDYYVYVWNFETETMEVEQKPLHFNTDANYYSIEVMAQSSTVRNAPHTAFLVRTADSTNEYGELEGDVQMKAFLLDFETLELKEVQQTNDTTLLTNSHGLVTKDAICVYNPTGELQISVADTHSEELILTPLITNQDTLTSETSEESQNEDSSPLVSYGGKLMEVHEGNLYLMDRYSDMGIEEASIEVFDIETGGLLYKGAIEVNPTNSAITGYELSLYEISFDKD